MARYWKEKLDPQKHVDFMTGYQCGHGSPTERPKDNLLDSWVYFVVAGGNQLQFISVEQVQEALEYFSIKNHGSKMRPGVTLEHYWQAWYERLPKGMHGQRSKQIWISALKALLDKIESNGVDIGKP